MAFSDQQIRRLKAKLDNRRVKARQHDGRDLFYVEGWYVMAEANRIFGFDGWDRLSLSHQLLYERREAEQFQVAYHARVRVIVRAGPHNVVREGSGFGSSTNADAGEAHELALKAAETDATKRALATFGNRFGLSLYDKDQAGVTKPRPPAHVMNSDSASSPASSSPAAKTTIDQAEDASSLTKTTIDQADEADEAERIQSALIFLKATRERLGRASSAAEIDDVLQRTSGELERLRDTHRDLRNRRGIHLADVVLSIASLRRQEIERHAMPSTTNARFGPLRIAVDKSRLALATVRRHRDRDHLKRVATLPCLVCGRVPSQAHHIRFAQDRGLALKVSDEFVVPLCAIDHNALHRAGDERDWWRARGVDPIAYAHRLWTASRATKGPSNPATKGESSGANDGNTHQVETAADRPERSTQ